MTDISQYMPPKVWVWSKPSGHAGMDLLDQRDKSTVERKADEVIDVLAAEVRLSIISSETAKLTGPREFGTAHPVMATGVSCLSV